MVSTGIQKAKVSRKQLDREFIRSLRNLRINRDSQYGSPVWILEEGEEAIPTEFFGYEKDQLKFDLYQNIRFEKRFLIIEGRDGHTILMPNDSTYGFPTGNDCDQILEKIPGELCKDVSYFSDQNFLYIVDTLKVDWLITDTRYNSISLFSIHSENRNIQSGYLLQPGNLVAAGYWYGDRCVDEKTTIKGVFVRKKIAITTVKLDKFAEFVFFNR